MGQFDFLNDDQPARETGWEHEPIEHRDTGLFDEAGRRIGFEIHRSVQMDHGVARVHVRWVSVTKDGEWIRNELTTHHATREEAEEEVERRVRKSTTRYVRLAAERAVAVPSIIIDTSRKRRGKAKPARTSMQQLDSMQKGLDGCAKQLRGCGCALIMLGGLLLLPFVLALL